MDQDNSSRRTLDGIKAIVQDPVGEQLEVVPLRMPAIQRKRLEDVHCRVVRLGYVLLQRLQQAGNQRWMLEHYVVEQILDGFVAEVFGVFVQVTDLKF